MLSENSEHKSEHKGVGQLRGQRCLSGTENTLRAWWEGQQETWAQRNEKGGGNQQISLCHDDIHSFRDEREEEEEHKSMEEHVSGACDIFLHQDFLAISRKDETRCQGEE